MAIEQSDDGALRELALFAGAGGGILGGKLLGWRTVCAVEREAYPAQVLAQRQNDGILEPFPIWSDVCSFDGRPWRWIVDVISGGFPCQDISAAGKGAGITGIRSGLWGEFKRIIREVEPRFVFVENSPMLTSRGLDVVLGDLAEMGFDAEWGCLSAGDVGAPHKRERVWIVAHPAQNGFIPLQVTPRQLRKGQSLVWDSFGTALDHVQLASIGAFHGKHNALAAEVDRLAAIGNGQVPIVAATAFQLLLERLTNNER